MFEITRNDLDAFDHYQYEGYLHPNAEYDFTFEARWLIIHRFDHEKVVYEGVDFAGDCLSSVIIVRLPFPRRSALMNLKRAKCKSKYHFVRTYAVPEMLIKLRQGAGRLIRTESDTGVLSILDVRAVRSAYAGSVNQALKQFPLVSSVEEIEQFIRSVKPASYFADNHPNNEADLNSCSRKGD